MNRVQCRTQLVKQTGRYDWVGTSTSIDGDIVPDYTIDNGADRWLDAAVRRLDEQIKLSHNRKTMVLPVAEGQETVNVENLRTIEELYFRHRTITIDSIEHKHILGVPLTICSENEWHSWMRMENEGWHCPIIAMRTIRRRDSQGVPPTLLVWDGFRFQVLDITATVAKEVEGEDPTTALAWDFSTSGLVHNVPTSEDDEGVVTYTGDAQDRMLAIINPEFDLLSSVTVSSSAITNGWIVGYAKSEDLEMIVNGQTELIEGHTIARNSQDYNFQNLVRPAGYDAIVFYFEEDGESPEAEEVNIRFVQNYVDGIRLFPTPDSFGILTVIGWFYTVWGSGNTDTCWWSELESQLLIDMAQYEGGVRMLDENVQTIGKRIEDIKRSKYCDSISEEVKAIGGQSRFRMYE